VGEGGSRDEFGGNGGGEASADLGLALGFEVPVKTIGLACKELWLAWVYEVEGGGLASPTVVMNCRLPSLGWL